MVISLRVAAVHLYALPLERVFGARTLAAAAVRHLVSSRFILDAVSFSARAKGVRPGMSQAEARARLPELEVRDRDVLGERRMLESAAEVLLPFSSAIEVVSPDVLLIEIGRSQRALADRGLADEEAIATEIERSMEAFGHAVTVAIADDADTARTLATYASAQRFERAAHIKKSSNKAPRARRGRSSHEATNPSAPPSSLRAANTAPAERSPESSPHVIAPPGGSAGALKSLPITALVWTEPEEDPENKLRGRLETAVSSFHLLGVREIGHLATFPPAQVASRYGDAGALLMARAAAERTRPLRTFIPPEQLIETFELESATQDLEPISFILKRLLDRIEARLFARGLAASLLELRFLLDPSRKIERLKVQLARPVRSARTLLRLCRERISGALPGEVRSITVEAVAPVADHGAQLDLFSQQLQRIERVEELIARLQASLGEHAIFAAQVEDTHRPEAAWCGRPFAIEAAFEELIVAPKRRSAIVSHDALARSAPREAYVLPAPDESLNVTGTEKTPRIVERLPSAPWPKPVQRKKEDDPLTPLPPRPIELLSRPEPARFEDPILSWRNERHRVIDFGRRERFECEWWQEKPLDREYFVVELEDGRRLWCFLSQGELFVHGIFD